MENTNLLKGAIELSEAIGLEIGEYNSYSRSIEIDFYEDGSSAVELTIYDDNIIQIKTDGYLTSEQLYCIGQFAKNYVETREKKNDD